MCEWVSSRKERRFSRPSTASGYVFHQEDEGHGQADQADGHGGHYELLQAAEELFRAPVVEKPCLLTSGLEEEKGFCMLER